MNDGLISHNSALSMYLNPYYYASLGNGGGVYISNSGTNPCAFIMNSGEISENSASSYVPAKEMGHGGGVYVLGGDDAVTEPGTFTMLGGEISGNNASDSGDGVFVNNKEKAYNSGSQISPIDITRMGNAKFNIQGAAVIHDNAQDDLYLRDSVSVSVTDSLSGIITVDSETPGDAPVFVGDGYILVANDKDTLHTNGYRLFELDSELNAIVLRAIDITDGFELGTFTNVFVYSGQSITPAVNVISKGESKFQLTHGVHYTVSYSSNTMDKGVKTITVGGIGEFKGYIEETYEIVPRDINISEANIPEQTFTGKKLQPVAALTVLDLNMSLLRGEDNQYVITGYGTNIEPGTGTVIIEGRGNYNGSKTVTFNIKKDITPSKPAFTLIIANIANQVYSGKACVPTVKITDSGKLMVKGVDYKLSYSNNIKTGTATVTIEGLGKYKGKRTATFIIIPKKASISKITSPKKGSLKVSWKKDTQATGYEIVIATNNKFTKGKKTATVKSYKTVNKTFTKLSTKKVYYAKVRSYKTINGKKYYGAYSAVNKLKTK
jgi:hypothetical protein